MIDLPETLTASPEQEAIELALDHLIFEPLEEDAKARAEAKDEETPPLRAYALLDASQSADIPICLEGFSSPARCLFDGEAFENLAEVAPWLVELTRYSDIWDWFVEEGYGKNWGLLIHSRLTLTGLKTRLKQFLQVEDESGEIYYFKYYRPSHFNDYAPAFDTDQRQRFWRTINGIYAEDCKEPATLHHHAVDSEGGPVHGVVDLVAVGSPHLIQPASPDDVQALIDAAKGAS